MPSYIISFAMQRGHYRHIQIDGQATLHALCQAFLQAYDLPDPSEPSFTPVKQQAGKRVKYSRNNTKTTIAMRSVKIADTCLAAGGKMVFQTMIPRLQATCKTLKVLPESTPVPVVTRKAGMGHMQHAHIKRMVNRIMRQEALRHSLERAFDLKALDEGTRTLLVDYLLAASHLYGIIAMADVHALYTRHHPEVPLEAMNLLAFLLQQDADSRIYLADAQGVAPDTDNFDVKHDYFLVEYTVPDPDIFTRLREEQLNAPYFMPPEEEFLRYADQEYVERSAAYLRFRDFVRTQGLREDEMDEFMLDIVEGIRFMYDEDDALFEPMEHYGVVLKNRKAASHMLELHADLHNHTRTHVNRGWTPLEVERRFRELLPSAPEAYHPTPKPGRNQPCPCGSGKKYKHCCGKAAPAAHRVDPDTGVIELFPGKTGDR